MKTRMLALAAALLAGGFTVTQTFAADGADGAPGHARWGQRLAEKLNLTAGQRAQIKAILAGEKGTLAARLGSVHEARKNLRAAIRADDAGEASVRAAAAAVGAAEADLAVERMKLYAKIAPILTGRQREELAALQQQADDFIDGALRRAGSRLGD